ncbi:MAG: hypothetical protein RL186_544 [Pseudomonadota bacterium]
MASARSQARGPAMVVTDIESRLGTRFTLHTLRALKRRYCGVRFVWLMGGDNLAGFEDWLGWEEIARQIPICVVSRPGAGPRARLGRLVRRFAGGRLPLERAARLPFAKPPVWVYLPARWHGVSSTALRARGLGLTP